MCVPERECVYAATDGRDGQRMERWVNLHVYMCVRACVRPCLRACDPVCENGMIMLDQMDRWTDGWMDGLID